MAENSRKMAKNGLKTVRNSKNGAETANFTNFATGEQESVSIRVHPWLGFDFGFGVASGGCKCLKNGQKQPKTGDLAGKQENFRKSGGVDEFFVFSCPFPVFLLKSPFCAGVPGGLAGPRRTKMVIK